MSLEEKLLVKIQGLLFFSGSLAGVFLNVFLFKLGGFQLVIQYNLITLIVLVILYIFSGELLRRFSSRDLMRVGLLSFALLFGILFLLREQSLRFIVPLAILNGFGNGNFWPGNNLSQYILTKEETRHLFFGRQNFWINIAQAFGPIIGGVLIKVLGTVSTIETGYAVLFLVVAILMFYNVAQASKLPLHSKVEFSIFQIFAHKRTKSWLIVLQQQFLYGLFDVAFGTISGILIFLIVKGEFLLGTVNTTSAIVFALSSLIAGGILQRNKHAYLLGMIMAPIGFLIFSWQQNLLGILSLIFVINVFLPYLNISTSKAIYDVMDRVTDNWQNKYHFLIERDSVLGLGRIINYFILFLIFTPYNQVEIAKSWLLVIPVVPLVIGLLQWFQYNKTFSLYNSRLKK